MLFASYAGIMVIVTIFFRHVNFLSAFPVDLLIEAHFLSNGPLDLYFRVWGQKPGWIPDKKCRE